MGSWGALWGSCFPGFLEVEGLRLSFVLGGSWDLATTQNLADKSTHSLPNKPYIAYHNYEQAYYATDSGDGRSPKDCAVLSCLYEPWSRPDRISRKPLVRSFDHAVALGPNQMGLL